MIELSFSNIRKIQITECEYKDLQIALGKQFVINRSNPTCDVVESYGCFDGSSKV